MHDHHEHTLVHFAQCPGIEPCWCPPKRYAGALAIAVAISMVQLIGWHHSNSLALLGDTGHVIGDAIGFAFALTISIHAIYRPHNEHRRVKTMGFAIQIMLITLAIGWTGIQAYGRLLDPPPVISIPLMISATIGGLGNIGQLAVLGELKGITAEGARGHAVSDLASSAAVICGGILVWITGNVLWDPIVSLVIVMLLCGYVYTLFTEFGHDDH